MGYFEGDALRFAGKVGTGFTQAEARVLLKKLQGRAAKASPFASLPTDARRGAHFIRPDLVAHINFSEWTPDGKLRHPSFQGLREDKPAREVVREKEKPLSAIAKQARPLPTRSAKARKEDTSVAHVVITHPIALWPDAGITKLELAQYYEAIAPITGTGRRSADKPRRSMDRGQCFFQRHVTDGMSSHVLA